MSSSVPLRITKGERGKKIPPPAATKMIEHSELCRYERHKHNGCYLGIASTEEKLARKQESEADLLRNGSVGSLKFRKLLQQNPQELAFYRSLSFSSQMIRRPSTNRRPLSLSLSRHGVKQMTPAEATGACSRQLPSKRLPARPSSKLWLDRLVR